MSYDECPKCGNPLWHKDTPQPWCSCPRPQPPNSKSQMTPSLKGQAREWTPLTRWISYSKSGYVVTEEERPYPASPFVEKSAYDAVVKERDEWENHWHSADVRTKKIERELVKMEKEIERLKPYEQNQDVWHENRNEMDAALTLELNKNKVLTEALKKCHIKPGDDIYEAAREELDRLSYRTALGEFKKIVK